jgi:hypothetical protein
MKTLCKDCRYYDHYVYEDKKIYICRRFPPIRGSLQYDFPVTFPGSWCGEWKEKEEIIRAREKEQPDILDMDLFIFLDPCKDFEGSLHDGSSVRLWNCLKNFPSYFPEIPFKTVRDLTKLSEKDLLRVRNLGRKSLSELKLDILAPHGLSLSSKSIYESPWPNNNPYALTIREQNILNFRKEGLTLKKIGVHYGISATRVRQIEQRALYKKRRDLTDDGRSDTLV